MRALLFDMDGTLADTEPFHFQALRALMRQGGGDLTEVGFDALSGRSSAAVFAELFPQAEEAGLQALVARKEEMFRDLTAGLEPLPGLKILLAGAHAEGLRKGLVTNAARDNVNHVLSVLGLETAFDTIVLAGDLARAKPIPCLTRPRSSAWVSAPKRPWRLRIPCLACARLQRPASLRSAWRQAWRQKPLFRRGPA